MTTGPSAATSAAAAAANAAAAADALNAQLLQSDHEHKLSSLEKNYDSVTETCNSQRNQITELQQQLHELQERVTEKESLWTTEKARADREEQRANDAQENEKSANERMARYEVEGDSLRQEISRLSSTNASLNTQLTEVTAASSLSTSSSAPLQYELSRLKSELEAMNSHTTWLENELSTRTNQTSTLKSTHSQKMSALTTKVHQVESQYEEASSELSLLKLKLSSSKQRMGLLQKELLEKEQLHADIVHELQLEIQSERNLVSLKNQNITRLEDRYNDAVREIDTIKALADAAEREHAQEMEDVRGEVERSVRLAVEERDGENEKRVEEMKKQLEGVIVEKTKLEDILMGSGNLLAIGDGTGTRSSRDPSTTATAATTTTTTATGGEPLTLTKLYDKLAEKEQELRNEKAERRKVELYLERIHEDFERIAPKQHQQRREYELAMAQMGDMQNRIKDALLEAQIAREELDQNQREGRQTEAECRELRLENSDLARQVQLLLKKSMSDDSDGDLAMEIQSQNQQLLKEHHRFSNRVKELEEELNSNSTQLKLRDALSSLKELEEERENQATLVANIVQQRDLYRALLAKNDAQILAAAGEGGGNAIVAAKDQIEKYTEVESRNKELVDTVSKLNADLLSATNAKQGLEERLKRLDVHAADLTQNANKIQNELLAAHAATARSNAEASFQMQKVTRLEESLEISKNEVSSLNGKKAELQRLNGELQSIIGEHEANLVKVEENLRQAQVQLRLSETKVQSLQAAENRLNAENTSLRSELSRHAALQESMRKIESGISARSTNERDRLDEEVKRLASELSAVKSQHALEVEKLQNQLSDANMKAEQMGKNQQTSLEEVIKAKNDNIGAKAELEKLTTKCGSLERELNAAKMKLGDEDVDLSEQDKLQSVTAQVEKLKQELQAATKRAEDYQKMAKASEATLAESTKASNDFKTNVTDKIKKLQEELRIANRDAKVRQEAFDGLTADLSKSRAEQEKSVDSLKSSIDTLKSELETCKSDRDSWKSQTENLLDEIKIHQADVKAAKDNYERELALHADARKELQEVRETAIKESRLHESAAVQLENMTSEMTKQENQFNDIKERIERNLNDSERKLEQARAQNSILHSQLATMGEKVDKIQAERTSTASQDEIPESDDNTSKETASLRKQVTELREVVSYMRSERDIYETQLQSARLSAERERASGEITKKSLVEARNELEVILKKSNNEAGTDSNSSSEIKLKLKQAEEQLVLLRESNKLLREESEKLDKKIQVLEKETDDAKKAFGPADEKCRELEVDKAALEAEKASLVREVDVWKERVTSLVTKFHQIDPEEHSKALAQVEECKKECAKLNTAKENAERQSAAAKNLIIQKNKEMNKFKSLYETSKINLDKAKKELETVQKEKASALSEKEINQLKEDKKTASQELASTKVRVENLSEILKRHKKKYTELQLKLQEAEIKEQTTKTSLEREKESHQALTKAHDQLKIALKKQKEKDDSTTIETTEGKQRSDVAPVATKVSQSTSQTKIAKKDVKNIPPIPKVPSGGFTFAPSDSNKSSLEKTSIGTSVTKDSSSEDKAKVEPKTGKELPDQKSKPLPKKPVVKESDISNTAKPLKSQDSTIPSKKEDKLSNAKNSEKPPLPKQDNNKTTSQQSSRNKKGSLPLDVGKSGGSMEIKVSATSNVTTEQSKSGGSGGNTPTPKTEENNLREKLMKRKRELAKKLEAQNATKKVALASSSDTPTAPPASTAVSTSNSDKQSNPNPTPKKDAVLPSTSISNSESTPASQKKSNKTSDLKKTPLVVETVEPKGNDSKIIGDKVVPKPDDESQDAKPNSKEDAPSTLQEEAKKDTLAPFASTTSSTIFGAGKAPVFGSGLSVSAKSFTPSSFGNPTTSFGSSDGSTSGAFLNLKPPGSGQSAPIFGSSTKIQLPTPSTPSNNPSTPSLFGASFGSTSVFGSSFSQPTKKRALETGSETNQEESSNKMTRIEDKEEHKGVDTDTSKNVTKENKGE